MILGIINPIEIVIFMVIYIIITILALIYVFVNEESNLQIIWTIFILFVPFLGAIVYLAKHFYGKK